MEKNIIVNVNLKGGWIGLFSSPAKVIQAVMDNYNNQGWSFAYSLPPKSNPLFIIVQLVCMCCTLGFYIPIPGYMMVFKKKD